MIHRIALISDGPAALQTAQELVRQGMFVDLITAVPAPFGLIHHGGEYSDGQGHTPSAAELCESEAPFRLVGNVSVGTDVRTNLSIGEIESCYATAIDLGARTNVAVIRDILARHRESLQPDRCLFEVLDARGIPYTTWQGWHEQIPATDWAALDAGARGVPVCI